RMSGISASSGWGPDPRPSELQATPVREAGRRGSAGFGSAAPGVSGASPGHHDGGTGLASPDRSEGHLRPPGGPSRGADRTGGETNPYLDGGRPHGRREQETSPSAQHHGPRADRPRPGPI